MSVYQGCFLYCCEPALFCESTSCSINIIRILSELQTVRQFFVVARTFRATSENIARICHTHPTLSETVHEAALAVDGRALNI